MNTPAKVGIGVVALLAVIGFATSQAEPEQAKPTPQRTTQAPQPAAKATNCEAVTDEFAQQIIGEHELVKASAVKADSGNYFVAIEFLPPDGKSATGVWQSLTLDAGPFRSVDGFAKNYTRWPDSGNAGAAIVDEAKGCLK